MADVTPLEKFVLEWVETVGGVWQTVEPQVYDVMLPETAADQLELAVPEGVFRLAFDPEALADHPGAHLMLFGNPILDHIFEQAQALGQVARVYLSGYNLSPHNLPSLLERGIQLPQGVALQLGEPRAYHFTSALFWFQATFISDEKEQDLFSVGVDLYYGRLVRHLEENIQSATLSESRPFPYPDAPRIPLTQAYALAREEATRAVTVAAHARLAELRARVQRESQRVIRYFADMRAELAERQARAAVKGDAPTRFEGQLQALDREEQVRLSELRQKMVLSVQVRLLNLLLVVQPKLRVPVRLVSLMRPRAALRNAAPKERESVQARQRGEVGQVELVWDPATGKVEAFPCPACGRPTLALALTPTGRIVCADCAPTGAPLRR